MTFCFIREHFFTLSIGKALGFGLLLLILILSMESINADSLDVDQSLYNRGFPIRDSYSGGWGGAQNFTPSFDTFTRAELYLRILGNQEDIEFNLTAELREETPNGTLLSATSLGPYDVSEDWSWISIDFDDISVNPGIKYCVVLQPPGNMNTSYGYEWGYYSDGNVYDGGAFWYTDDTGGNWTDLPDNYDFTFRTFGYNMSVSYDYLIITNNSFYDTFKNNFSLWKISTDEKIDSILIVNISDIIADPNCWVNGSEGDAIGISKGNHWILDNETVTSNFSRFNDTQCKVRNFLRRMVDECNVSYVLLGGNKNIIPPRMTRQRDNTTESYATDYYYANLNKTLNNDFDDVWMEHYIDEDDIIHYDGIDWKYNLLVGRVLIDSIYELDCWINKTKNYVNYSLEDNYLNRIIYAEKNYHNEHTEVMWNAYYKDEIPSNFTVYKPMNDTAWEKIDDVCNDGNKSGICPIVDFNWLPNHPDKNEQVNFTDNSTDTDGNIISWYWQFGDETESISQNPIHSYDHNGSFIVSLQVIDNESNVNITFKTIDIGIFDINFSYEPIYPNANDLIYFNDTTIGFDTEFVDYYYWDFGDFGYSYDQNATYSYSENGIYHVTFIICYDGIMYTTSRLLNIGNVTIGTVNPGPPTSTNLSEFDGCQILIHSGHGGTLYDPYNPINLINPHKPNFIYTTGCSSGDFGKDTSSRAEKWMSSYNGMFAGVVNSNSGFFGVSDTLIASSLNHLLNIKDCKMFCEAHFKARLALIDVDDSWFWPHIYKTSNFFGDPALEINLPGS